MMRIVKMIFLIMLLWLIGSETVMAQKVLEFHPSYGKDLVYLADSSYQSNDEDSITITQFRFYISDIELWNDKNKTWEEHNFHLINANEYQTLRISLAIPYDIVYDKIKFKLGIDSLTNVSGAMGGDLDPMKGMYWTWQSGYINVKLEGNSPLCKTRNNAFEFHLGGYHTPFNCLKTVTLPIIKSDNLKLYIDLKKALSSINLKMTNQIMTPSKLAVDISEKIAKAFETRL